MVHQCCRLIKAPFQMCAKFLTLSFPFYRARKIVRELRGVGIRIGRKRCRRLMRAMGIEALVPKPSTSIPDKQHKKYPYLLRESAVSAPDVVWAADITYVPMYEGHVYLVAIMDWHTRAVLSWRVSTTMDAGFCVEAYREALRVAGRAPAIMNTDQGSQFTGEEWIEVVEASGARVSMDGKGRWMDKRRAAPGLHRATLAELEIRGTAAVELRSGGGGHRPDREVDGSLQPSAQAPGAGLRSSVEALSPRANRRRPENTNKTQISPAGDGGQGGLKRLRLFRDPALSSK